MFICIKLKSITFLICFDICILLMKCLTNFRNKFYLRDMWFSIYLQAGRLQGPGGRERVDRP